MTIYIVTETIHRATCSICQHRWSFEVAPFRGGSFDIQCPKCPRGCEIYDCPYCGVRTNIPNHCEPRKP